MEHNCLAYNKMILLVALDKVRPQQDKVPPQHPVLQEDKVRPQQDKVPPQHPVLQEDKVPPQHSVLQERMTETAQCGVHARVTGSG